MSLGGRRQLLDVLCFAVLHNSTIAHRAAAVAADGRPRRAAVPRAA